MKNKFESLAETFQEVTATRRMNHRSWALLPAIAAVLLTAHHAGAQGVSSGPCFAGATCIVNTLAAATPNPVPVGSVLTLTTTPAAFPFSPGTIVWVTPINGGVSRGMLTSLVVLCGPAGGVALPGGGALPGANQTCNPTVGGAVLSIPIPAGLEGDELAQKGHPAPAGFWNLFALTPVAGPRGMVFDLEAPLPRLVHFVLTGVGTGIGTGGNPPPAVYSVTPACVATPPEIVTGTVHGLNFQPGARVIVSYIYYVQPNGVFRTDYYGRDSRTDAIVLQQSSTQLTFEINLRTVHHTAGDPYTDGGNYYVQVQNPDGSVSGGPIYFTAKPFHGYGHC